MLSLQEYQNELHLNQEAIRRFADRCDKEYEESNNRGQLYADSDYETRIMLYADYSFNKSVDNEGPLYRSVL